VALFDWTLKHTLCFVRQWSKQIPHSSGRDFETEIPTFIRIGSVQSNRSVRSRCEWHVHQNINYIECSDSNETFAAPWRSDFIETRRVLSQSPKTFQSRIGAAMAA
jgi:hypothetical protein